MAMVIHAHVCSSDCNHLFPCQDPAMQSPENPFALMWQSRAEREQKIHSRTFEEVELSSTACGVHWRLHEQEDHVMMAEMIRYLIKDQPDSLLGSSTSPINSWTGVGNANAPPQHHVILSQRFRAMVILHAGLHQDVFELAAKLVVMCLASRPPMPNQMIFGPWDPNALHQQPVRFLYIAIPTLADKSLDMTDYMKTVRRLPGFPSGVGSFMSDDATSDDEP